MENQTSEREFYILAFNTEKQNKLLVFTIFLLLYLVGVFMNVTVIIVICTNHHLHSPMYLFLCNLALVDISFTTTTVPNLLYMLLSGKNRLPFSRCFTQVFFLYSAGSFENMLIAAMAYDRYVAICKPLHYHNILNKKMCTLFVIVIWVAGTLNSSFLLMPIPNMVFCRSRTIRQFYCDAKAMTAIACSGVEFFYACVYADFLSFALSLVICTLLSYAKLIIVIMSIKSKDGRKKAYSTCSSHVTVFVLYYSAGVVEYLLPTSTNSNTLEQTITVMYTVVTPMLNPLIYSLRNQELKKAIYKLIRQQL